MSHCMFDGCCLLVGGAGTVYDPSIIDASRARVDGGANAPGYFTGKHEKLDGDVNGNGAVNIVDAQIAYDIATILGMYADLPGYKAYHGAADITGPGGAPDGIVDAVDAFRIQYAALHGWE